MQHAVDLKPGDRDWRQLLAALKATQAFREHKLAHKEEAVKLYQEALALDDRQAQWWYNLGVAYLDQGRPDSAREVWQRAAALDPGNESYRTALESLKRPTEKSK
jgi:tetratricopeptide (TPR) repeat protein